MYPEAESNLGSGGCSGHENRIASQQEQHGQRHRTEIVRLWTPSCHLLGLGIFLPAARLRSVGLKTAPVCRGWWDRISSSAKLSSSEPYYSYNGC